MDTVVETLIATIPAGTATLVVSILTLLVRSILKQFGEVITAKLSNQGEKVDELVAKLEKIESENAELKKQLNKTVNTLNHVMDGGESNEEHTI